MTEDPYRVTKERMARLLHCSLSHYVVDLYFQAAGIATPSLTSLSLEQLDHTQDLAMQEEIIKSASVAVYAGE